MKHRILVPTEENAILCKRPETFPLLVMAAASRWLAYPTPGDVKWFEHLFELEYDGSPEFWSPYAITPAGVCVKPWASAARSYIGRAVSGGMATKDLDPAEWRSNLDNLLSDVLYADQAVAVAIATMQAQYVSPEGEMLMRRDALELRASQAACSGSLVVDVTKAKAMIAATAKYLQASP